MNRERLRVLWGFLCSWALLGSALVAVTIYVLADAPSIEIAATAAMVAGAPLSLWAGRNPYFGCVRGGPSLLLALIMPRLGNEDADYHQVTGRSAAAYVSAVSFVLAAAIMALAILFP
jgi:hypothetical protein